MTGQDVVDLLTIERSYECARQCLLDACFVANEREYYGIVALVEAAIDDLDIIGRLAGIVPQPQICGPVVDEEARNE